MPDTPPSAATGIRYTWHDFVALHDDDPRELLDGQLLEMDVPTRLHEWVVATLVHRLTTWALARQAGIVLASGYKVRIREDRGFMPDVQHFARGGRKLPDPGLDAGAPDLAMEVVSATTARYDRRQRLEGYAEIGVPEYWIVDPDRRTLERLRLASPGRYGAAETFSGTVEFAPDSFPGLTIALGELWQLPAWFEA
jgi:Uma2 family endonuclease